jgi:hypothetical protein
MTPPSFLDEFIPLDRTFHELALEAGAGDDVELTRILGQRDALRWPNLLSEYRVILLSEAGSGKTEEIRNIARKLRRDGESAFFVRIEHVSQSFEDAFEEGNFEEFSAWAASGEEGWLLLDSVDEARLRDPKDFERAIRKLGRLLAPVLQQAHIGRTTAWRAKADLLLCRTALPYRPAEKAANEEASADEMQDIATKNADGLANPADVFKIVAIDDLHGAQIDAFLRGKKVQKPKAFRDAVDRKDAWSLTTRPQDLAELVEFWNDHQRIGSRLELMQSNIARRLEERDQDRSEAHPIAIERLRLGARLVAAATTLGQESAIRVPDGADNAKGIAIREVLTDWDDIDCATLLARPIFDEGIYGTVRFHHRSVREYLTAEWLHALIVDEGSRARIEGLFFRSQYGIEVIVPTMRPVLPWLAILDERILARVCRLAPEIIFEGGDPSQLPRETRSQILRQACEQLAQPAHGRSLTDYTAVQRFANVDLTDDIKALLSSKWSEGNWRSLVPEFGEPIARAFRDGAVSFWRGHRPQLLSEGAKANTTPFSAIFGLTGLSIETREEPGWPKGLLQADADIATRFALHELNGFPSWLPNLYVTYPQVVIDVVITEIDHELATENPESTSHYVLYDASWSGDWMWDRLASLVIARLRKPPKSIGNLRAMLNIVQGSSLDGPTIAKFAAQMTKATRNLATAPMWFGLWVGVDPAVAIPALAARLAEMKENTKKTLFAMRFITALVGDRSESRGARQAYRKVRHMKALFLLMQDYVRENEDIDRAGKGIYSPELRDDAQNAREALFAFIRETPGKEAFLALMDISRAHPAETARPWMAFHAKEKATLDADALAWSPRQVRDFHDRLDRTPANHRDLWYLALDRLLDLKHDLEEGDASIASILQPVDRETDIRKYIGNWCRERSGGRYVIPQEEELADAKRPDLRFHGVGFDGPVPAELKLADKWTGPHLFERLEIQLCGDYLRDKRSSRGIFGLVYHGTKPSWDLPKGGRVESFAALVEALQSHWEILAPQFPGVEDIRVIGIDLTKRGIDAKTAAARKRKSKAVAKTSEEALARAAGRAP